MHAKSIGFFSDEAFHGRMAAETITMNLSYINYYNTNPNIVHNENLWVLMSTSRSQTLRTIAIMVVGNLR